MDDLDLIQLSDAPLDIAAALAAVNVPEAGGIDIFIGTTRAERHEKFGELLALEYSVYPEMALSEMCKLAGIARQQWPICRIAMVHRTGRCPVGEASIIIAVSCPHRGDAFAACRFLIDQVKAKAPIWKKEIYAEAQSWQGGR